MSIYIAAPLVLALNLGLCPRLLYPRQGGSVDDRLWHFSGDAEAEEGVVVEYRVVGTHGAELVGELLHGFAVCTLALQEAETGGSADYVYVKGNAELVLSDALP